MRYGIVPQIRHSFILIYLNIYTFSQDILIKENMYYLIDQSTFLILMEISNKSHCIKIEIVRYWKS